MTDLRPRFPIEPAILDAKVLDFLKRPMSLVLQYQIIPSDLLSVRSQEQSGIREYSRDLDNFEVKVSGTERFPNHGDTVAQDTSYKVYGDKTVSANFHELRSFWKDGNFTSYPTISKQLSRNMSIGDHNITVGNKLEAAFRTMNEKIDNQFFDLGYRGDHSVRENTTSVTTTVTAAQDGITDYLIQTDLSVSSEAVANELIHELQSKVADPLIETGVDNIDNIQFIVPQSVVSYITSYFKSTKWWYQDPNMGESRDRPTPTINAQGMPIVGLPLSALGEFDNTGSGGPKGKRGYAQYRRAFALAFDDYNRFENTVSVSGSLAGGAMSYQEGIVEHLNSLGSQYDTRADQYLDDLINTKGYWPGSNYIPGNIFNLVMFDTTPFNPDYIAFFIRAFMQVTRIAPTKGINLLFDETKLPGGAAAAAAMSMLRTEQTSRQKIDKISKEEFTKIRNPETASQMIDNFKKADAEDAKVARDTRDKNVG